MQPPFEDLKKLSERKTTEFEEMKKYIVGQCIFLQCIFIVYHCSSDCDLSDFFKFINNGTFRTLC